MHKLEEIAERIRHSFDAHTKARDLALTQARSLTRHCAHTIRAVHRGEHENAANELEAASQLREALRTGLSDYPNLYFAGYTQDALKEYAEASIVFAFSKQEELPTPEELKLEEATYLKGLAEAVGEIRRRILDLLRTGYTEEVERLLNYMDDIYAVLVTMDYPDAVTGGLRRLTDVARALIERTRGDVTLSLRHERLEQTLRQVEDRINGTSK